MPHLIASLLVVLALLGAGGGDGSPIAFWSTTTVGAPACGGHPDGMWSDRHRPPRIPADPTPVPRPGIAPDNDLPTLSVQVAGRVVESATVVPVVVRIDRASLRPVVVSLSLGGTADGADASLSATQAVIAPGSTETVLWLTVAADGAVEPSETVVVLKG